MLFSFLYMFPPEACITLCKYICIYKNTHTYIHYYKNMLSEHSVKVKEKLLVFSCSGQVQWATIQK